MMSWRQFRSVYLNGVVLQPVHSGENDQHGRSSRAAYDMARYNEYDAADAFGLRAMRGEGIERTWERNDIDAKTTVLGIVHNGEAVGYPIPQVRADGGIVSDSVGGLDVLVVSNENEIYAFEHPGEQLELRDETLYGDGTSWDLTTGQGSDGRELTRVPARRLYTLAWQDDHGRDSFYGLD